MHNTDQISTTETLQSVSPSSRYLIAVAGIPGSGKTTLASTVARNLNVLYHTVNHPNYPSSGPLVPNIAAAVPLDGFHLTRAQLSAMPNAEEAHYRRGAAFTFDGTGYLQLVRSLREPICPETGTIQAPSFDHAIKDPVQDDIAIHPSVRVVLLEGNYVALNEDAWREARDLVSEVWFVDVSEDTAVERLVKRHVKAGISENEEHARKRAWENDIRNGREILEKLDRDHVNEWVTSKEDKAWAPEGTRAGEDRAKEESGEKDIRPPVLTSETFGSRMSQNSIVEMAGNGVGL